MKTVSLAEISHKVDYGVTASADANPVGPKFLRITDIQDGMVDWPSVPYCQADERKLAGSRLGVGDIVFARTGATTGKSFLIRQCPENAVFASYLIRVRPNKLVDPIFLSHFFDSAGYWQQIAQKAEGAAQPGVNASKLQELEVPLPPIEEQRRIAAILDQADALRAKRRAALAQLDEMAQAIFVEMFGDLSAKEQRWPVVPVATYVSSFQGGKSLEADPDNAAARHRVLKISAVTGSVFKPEESKPLADDYTPPAEHFVRPGDLLFSRANTTELVGAVAYVEGTPDNLVLPDKLWRFVWRDPTQIEPLFIWVLFQQRQVREDIERRATGTSGSMKNISQGKLLAMRTILPSHEAQIAFTKRLQALRSVRSTHLKAASALDTLFTSLQHRAFRGEL